VRGVRFLVRGHGAAAPGQVICVAPDSGGIR
jgi:hypothetical protein